MPNIIVKNRSNNPSSSSSSSSSKSSSWLLPAAVIVLTVGMSLFFDGRTTKAYLESRASSSAVVDVVVESSSSSSTTSTSSRQPAAADPPPSSVLAVVIDDVGAAVGTTTTTTAAEEEASSSASLKAVASTKDGGDGVGAVATFGATAEDDVTAATANAAPSAPPPPTKTAPRTVVWQTARPTVAALSPDDDNNATADLNNATDHDEDATTGIHDDDDNDAVVVVDRNTDDDRNNATDDLNDNATVVRNANDLDDNATVVRNATVVATATMTMTMTTMTTTKNVTDDRNTTTDDLDRNNTTDDLDAVTVRNATTDDLDDDATVPEEERFFRRHDGVVIVTKIDGHDVGGWRELIQSMCLLHRAYNSRPELLYDVVVFTTVDVTNDPSFATRIETLKDAVAPAKLTIVTDNKGLAEEIEDLTPTKRDLLLARCNVTDPSEIHWKLRCVDEVKHLTNPRMNNVQTALSYHWQAEFRSVHIWNHPALAAYKTMLWMDSDGFCTEKWKIDPIDWFLERKAVVMFDHFPQGSTNLPRRIQDAFGGYNASLCDLRLNPIDGTFNATIDPSKCKDTFRVPAIHGFFHVTDLDFYRTHVHKLKALLGDCFLCRNPDDQLAITLPAALYAPERSFEMSMAFEGANLNVFHNFRMDGKRRVKPAGFRKFWAQNASVSFPEAVDHCVITEAGRRRR